MDSKINSQQQISTVSDKVVDSEGAKTVTEKKGIASVAGIVIMGIANICFALMTILLKILYLHTNITVNEVTYLRGLSLAVFNIAYAKATGVEILKVPPLVARQLIGRVFFGIFAMYTFYMANKLLPISLSSALSATDPIFTAIIGWLLFSEKITRFDVAALILAFFGVLCIVLNPMRTNKSTGDGINPVYMLAPLLSAVACGFVYNFTRQIGQLAHWVIAPAYFGLGIACIVPLIMFSYSGITLHVTIYTAASLALIVVMYIFGFLGQMFMSKAFQIEIAGRVAVINYSQIVYMFISDVLLFHEQINILDILGAILIIGCNFTIGLLKFLNIIQ